MATFAAAGYAIFIHHRSNPFADRGKIYSLVRLGLEAIVFLLWIATAILMLRNKNGCGHRLVAAGVDVCRAETKNPIKWVDHPFISWDIAVAFSFIEMYVEPSIVPFLLNGADRNSRGQCFVRPICSAGFHGEQIIASLWGLNACRCFLDCVDCQQLYHCQA